MTTRISPNFRQQILCPQQVSVNTTVTGLDAYKVWTHTVVGTIIFTLPAALKGAGPMYFCEQLATNVIVVQPRPNDHIVGFANGVPLTMSTTGAFVGLFCELDGTWSFVSASLTAGALPGGFSGFANPTAQVKLTPVNGSATTAMRSDAAPSLDVTISPTWTGNHTFFPTAGTAITFGNGSGANGFLGVGQAFSVGQAELFTAGGTPLGIGPAGAANLNFYTNNLLRVAVTSTGSISVNAPTTGVALTLAGTANQNTLLIQASATSGQSFGADIRGGTTSADRALIVRNQATTATFMLLAGDGSGTLGPSSILGLSWLAAGNVTVAAPTSGTTLTITGLASAPINALINTGSGSIGLHIIGASPLQRIQDTGAFGSILELQAINGTAIVASNWATTPTPLSFRVNGVEAIGIATTRAVTISAPTAGNALTVTGFANAFATTINGSSTSGQSQGLQAVSGTTAADTAFRVLNQAATLTFQQIFGDGHGTLGPSATLGLSWAVAGNVTVASPSSGTALTVTQNNAASSVLVNGSNAEGLRIASTAANGSFLQVYNSATFVGFFGAALQEFTGASATDLGIGCAAAKQIVFGIGTAAAVTISTTTLTLFGSTVVSSYVVAPTNGLAITMAGNARIGMRNTTNSVELLISADGSSVIFGAMTNHVLNLRSNNTNVMAITATTITGLGPTAAGQVDMLPDQGTFNGTLTGITGTPAIACRWTRQGALVTIRFGSATANSTATTMTMTGLPAAIQSANGATVEAPGMCFSNAGAALTTQNVACQFAAGTVTFFLNGNSAGWTNTATTKGINTVFWVSYLLF